MTSISNVLRCPAVLALAFILAVDSMLLAWVGVPVSQQLLMLLVWMVFVLAGHAVLGRILRDLPDRFTSLVVCSVFGLACYTGISFFLFHAGVQQTLHVDMQVASNLALGSLTLAAVVGGWRLAGVADSRPWITHPEWLVGLFGLASLVACLTTFGYVNQELRPDGTTSDRMNIRDWTEARLTPWNSEVVPQWGNTGNDRQSHLVAGPQRISQLQFPEAFIRGSQHFAVETTISGLVMLDGLPTADRDIAVAKLLTLIWLLLVAFWIFAIGKDILGLSAALAFVAVMGALLFAPLNLYLFKGMVGTYKLGPAAGTLYNNTTQLASAAIGLGGWYLALRALRGESPLLIVGCFLVAACLFFKPSLFSVAAPALALSGLMSRGIRWSHFVAGMLLLAAAAGVWFLYPRLMEITSLSPSLELNPFSWYQIYVPDSIRWGGNWQLAVAVALALTYASFFLPFFYSLGSHAEYWQQALRKPHYLAMLVLFLIGAVSGYFLAEAGRISHGNYMWGSAIAIIMVLPLLVRAMAEIPKKSVRHLAWGIYGAQLLSGGLNLFIFAWRGEYL